MAIQGLEEKVLDHFRVQADRDGQLYLDHHRADCNWDMEQPLDGAEWTLTELSRLALAHLKQDHDDAVEHRYLSTGCLHGEHAYCSSMRGINGEKRPAECKFCSAKCVCSCHE